MFSRMRILTAGLTIALLASVGLCQQQQNQTPEQNPQTKERQGPFGPGDGRGFRHGPGFGGPFRPEVLSQLNLTDDQKQQIHTIMQQSMENTKSQREELRQIFEKRRQGTLTAQDEARATTLREQLQTSMKDSQAKIADVLTTEQKTKLEELMKERRDNHERFGDRRRGGFPPSNQPNPSVQKPLTTPN